MPETGRAELAKGNMFDPTPLTFTPPDATPLALPTPVTSSLPNLKHVDTQQAMALIFDRCFAMDLIAVGSVRPGPNKVEPYLRAEHPLPGDRLGELSQRLFAVDPERLRYIQFVGYEPAACSLTRKGGTIDYKGGTLWFEAKNDYVHSYYAFTLDLDLGRPDTLTAEQGYAEVVGLVERGELPAPTMIAFSGRGLYLVYVVRDDDGAPLLNDESNRRHRLMIVDDLLVRVRDLSPDRRASRSLARWFKSPASARYYIFDIGNGVKTWTPNELIDFGLLHPVTDPKATTFSVVKEVEVERLDDAPMIIKPRRAKLRASTSKRTWTQAARPSIVRKAELERLAAHRGMGHKSGRHDLLFYYGAAVREIEFCRSGDMREAQKLATEAAFALNNTFEVPLPSEEVFSAMKSDGKIKHSNAAVAGDLNVTDTEVELLNLTSTIPAWMEQDKTMKKVQKQKQKEQVRLMIDYFIQNGHSVLFISQLTGVSMSTISTRKNELIEKLKTIPLMTQVIRGLRGRTFFNNN